MLDRMERACADLRCRAPQGADRERTASTNAGRHHVGSSERPIL